jgi:hypothetical protein
MSETLGLSRQQILAELFRSPHGDLQAYGPLGRQVCAQDPLFLAHGIAWNARYGTVRDSQLALPCLTLAIPAFPQALLENSLAHLAALTPRQLAGYVTRSCPQGTGVWPFLRTLHVPHARQRQFRAMLTQYLQAREACWPWWERTELSFHHALKGLYKIAHYAGSPRAKAVLFGHAMLPGSLRAILRQCAVQDATTVAGVLRQHQIPLLTALGYVRGRERDPVILAALIDCASPAQLTIYRAAFDRWNAETDAATRGALARARRRAAMTDTGSLRASIAAATLQEEAPALAGELATLTERQLDATPGIEGNWLVIGDKSGSMAQAIDVAVMLAGYLARKVTGKVLLCFVDMHAYTLEVTGCPLTEIHAKVAGIRAGGGTNLGEGLRAAQAAGFVADGVAIVSDGDDNVPGWFPLAYADYVRWLGKEPPLYLYHVGGRDQLTSVCTAAGLPYDCFPVPPTIDHYALSTLAQTMRANRFSLVQQVMDTPLLAIEQALRVPRRFQEGALCGTW